jgi:hypothetical protein
MTGIPWMHNVTDLGKFELIKPDFIDQPHYHFYALSAPFSPCHWYYRVLKR